LRRSRDARRRIPDRAKSKTIAATVGVAEVLQSLA